MYEINGKEYYSVKELSEIYGITRQAMYKRVNQVVNQIDKVELTKLTVRQNGKMLYSKDFRNYFDLIENKIVNQTVNQTVNQGQDEKNIDSIIERKIDNGIVEQLKQENEYLKSQIQVKDKQIASITIALNDSMNQNKQLLLDYKPKEQTQLDQGQTTRNRTEYVLYVLLAVIIVLLLWIILK